MTGGRSIFISQSFLALVAPYLERPDVTDIWCNAPGEVWLERIDGQLHHVEPLRRLRCWPGWHARSLRIGTGHKQRASFDSRAALPTALACNWRCRLQEARSQSRSQHHSVQVSLEARRSSGLLAGHGKTVIDPKPDTSDYPGPLLALGCPEPQYDHGVWWHVIRKTTLLNALIARSTPSASSLSEDTPELNLRAQQCRRSTCHSDGQGEAQASAESADRVAQTSPGPHHPRRNRWRSVHIPRAINTGHPGSLTTIHANTPQSALDQLAMLALQGNSGMTWDMVERMARATIDLIVQVGSGKPWAEDR